MRASELWRKAIRMMRLSISTLKTQLPDTEAYRALIAGLYDAIRDVEGFGIVIAEEEELHGLQ